MTQCVRVSVRDARGIARGVMYASGVPLASLGLRAFRVAGARLSALQGA